MTNDTLLESSCALLLESAKNFAKIEISNKNNNKTNLTQLSITIIVFKFHK